MMNNPSEDFFPTVPKIVKPEPKLTVVAKKSTAAGVSGDPSRLASVLWEKLRLHSFDHPIKKREMIEFLWPNINDTDYPDDPEREIRLIITDLIGKHCKLIGAGGRGFYSIQNEKDFARAKTYLLQKKLALEDRVGLLERNWKMTNGVFEDPPEQQQMGMEGV